VKALKVALVGLLLALLLMPAIGSVTYALADRCEDEAGCPGCPPGNCWVCASIPGGVTCYKPAP
jgi:hypothetical protein